MNIREQMRKALSNKSYAALERSFTNHRLIEGVHGRLLTYISSEIKTNEGITLYEKITTDAMYHLDSELYTDADTMYREYIKSLATSMVELINYTVTVRHNDRVKFWDCINGSLTQFKRGCDSCTVKYTPMPPDVLDNAEKTLPHIFMAYILTRRELTCWGVPPLGITETVGFEGVAT